MKTHTFKPVSPNVNFIDIEKKQLARWYNEGIVDEYLHKNDASTKRFSFLDGPITANNPMGVHHAWGRTYKDLWQRYFTMRGYKQRYQNGFDCQGLWVEVEVEKELGLRSKKDIENLVPGDRKASIAKFVDLCKARVNKYSAMQTEQSKRLAYFMDWDHSYYTMSDENNYMIWHALKKCHEKGWIHKSKDVVPWCPRCETAISQHEILTEDYKEVTHKSLYLELPIVGRNKEYLLVWTTTPWTVPGNVCVAIDKNIIYALVEGMTGNLFWVAKDRIEEVFQKQYKRIVKEVKGKELEGLRYVGPYDHLPIIQKIAKAHAKVFHTVILTDPLLMPISQTEGTGLVHTSTGTGEEDNRLGKKIGLPVFQVTNDRAEYLPEFGDLAGKNAKKHPEVVLDYLQQQEEKGAGWIFAIVPHTHRYPACWRCKTELIWKVTEEWYIGMDIMEKGGSQTLRELMKETAKQISWRPEFGLERELDWLDHMHDWLISKKNRYWGLALPIYECSCGWFTVIGSIEELKKKSVSGWDAFKGHSPHKPYIDEVTITCEKCKNTVSRVNDVGNVWLDAGIVPFSTLIDPKTKKLSYIHDKTYWSDWYPADFITESFPGQFKNWFYSLIAMATILEKKTSFKTVLGYASMLGEDGRPMHKSWGNSIEFNEGADKIGVDVMRFMFARENPEQNLLFGYKRADETRRQFHLLLWNVYNFFITYAQVDHFSPSQDPLQSTNILDQWILSNLHTCVQQVTDSFNAYNAQSAMETLSLFVSDLSLWYVRRSRDRVGSSVRVTEDKKYCYETLYTVLVTLCKLLAPVMPCVVDEMYGNLTGERSVHLTDWPNPVGTYNAKLQEEMALARKFVESIHAKRKEIAIPIRQPLAKVTVHFGRRVSDDIVKIICAEVNVKSLVWGDPAEELQIELDTAITPELKAEGDMRELIRGIQNLRKTQKFGISERISVLQIPNTYKHLTNEQLQHIQKITLADEIVWNDTIAITTGQQ